MHAYRKGRTVTESPDPSAERRYFIVLLPLPLPVLAVGVAVAVAAGPRRQKNES